jgi:hypothetical protein
VINCWTECFEGIKTNLSDVHEQNSAFRSFLPVLKLEEFFTTSKPRYEPYNFSFRTSILKQQSVIKRLSKRCSI